MTRQDFNLGFSYLAGSLRAKSDSGDELTVTDSDPTTGVFALDLPDDFDSSVSIDFQREVVRGGGARPDKVIGTCDACIYCGAREDLRDEHVIPYALEGEFVLRQASCRECEKMTTRFENAVLRDFLLPARVSLEIRTRRPKQRPDRLPLIEMVGGKRQVRYVPVDEHPTYIALPLFAPPARLRGADEPHLQLLPPGAWWSLVGRVHPIEASGLLGGVPVGIRLEGDVYAFARMIGKIAHGFVAAANLGDVATELPSLLRAPGEAIGWSVGGAPDILLTEPGLHAVGLAVIDGVVQVRVRLFAQLGGPEYLVVAGRIIEPGPADTPHVTIEPPAD